MKRIKVQQKLITGRLRLFWEAAINGFILFLSFLPLLPAQVWEAIKPFTQPSAQRSLPCPLFSSACMPWERKESSIPINYRQIRSVSTW